jgi:hypothetical protein
MNLILKIYLQIQKSNINNIINIYNTYSALRSINPEIIQESSKYNLSDYYVTKLAERRSFFKKLLPEQIMKWSPQLISSPMLRIPELLNDVAVQIYKNITSYMNDRKSTKKPINHIRKILKLTLTSPEDLKDETYIQILKQIKDHRD